MEHGFINFHYSRESQTQKSRVLSSYLEAVQLKIKYF